MRQPPYGVLLVSAVVLVMIVAVVAIVAVQQPVSPQEINDENVIGNVAYPGAYNSPNGLRGYLDIGTRTRIAGWSYDINAPTEPVTIEILVNNVVVDSFPTFQVRQDVNGAFGITGAHGFDIVTPQASLGSKILIRAVRASNGDITKLGEVRISGFGCTACTESTCADDRKLRRCVNGCYQPTTSCPTPTICADGACIENTSTGDIVGQHSGFYGFPASFFLGTAVTPSHAAAVTDRIYLLEKELAGGNAPFPFARGEYQEEVYGVSSPNGFILGDAAAPVNNDGDHSWDVIAHEMGHSFWSQSELFYTLATPGPFLHESTAVLSAQYVYERIYDAPDHFGLSGAAMESLDTVFTAERAYQQSRYEAYLAAGMPYTQADGENGVLTSQAFDYQMFLIGDQYGWEKYPRFWKGFSSHLREQFTFWQDGVSDAEETTYAIAALGVAFERDFRQEFKDLHFPVDDAFYNAVYPTICEAVNGEPCGVVTAATLTASPNPCTVPTGQTQCTSTLSWTSAGDAYTHVQVWNPTGVNVSCTPTGQAGTLIRQVAVNQPKTFRLYPATSCMHADADTTLELANVTISAVSATQGNYNATFVSLDVPHLMITGQTYTASVTMRNTGTSAWVGGRVSLDAIGIDGTAWNPGRIFLPTGVTVLPGQPYTFVFPFAAQPGKSIRLFSWKLRSIDLQQHFGQATPTNQESRAWVVTDTPYVGTPTMKHVTVWNYIIGDPTTKMCMTNPYTTICQTFYPQGDKVLMVRDDTLIVKYFRNDALDTVGVLKDGTAPDVPSMEGLRCLTRTSGSCANGPLPSMPLVADVPVLPASVVNRHLVTEEGLDVQMKQIFWWNPINLDTCQPSGTAGSITGSGKLFLLESYDFGGDVGVQQDVLVYEHVGGYPTDAPMAQLDPWGTMRLERYLFVEGKGFYQSDGIEDPDCRDNPSVQTCDGVYSRFVSFEPALWNRIEPVPVPIVDYCPNI